MRKRFLQAIGREVGLKSESYPRKRARKPICSKCLS
jgi:hypothetical protein